MILGKAEGTLLTGASLSGRTRGSRWPGPGVPGTSKQDSRASEPLAEERDTEGPQWEKNPTLGCLWATEML